RILDNIDSFKARNLGNSLNNLFSEDFWNKKLTANMSFSEMRSNINKYARVKSPLAEEDLDKIEYSAFVKNIFNWSDEYISKLRHEAKSPLQKKSEKITLYLIGIIACLSLVTILGWTYY